MYPLPQWNSAVGSAGLFVLVRRYNRKTETYLTRLACLGTIVRDKLTTPQPTPKPTGKVQQQPREKCILRLFHSALW